MKYHIRFKLRTLLVAATLLAVVMGLAVNHWKRSVSQRNAVRWLEAYGDKFRDRPGSMTDVFVYYDDELSWRETESRFVRDLPRRDGKLYNWVRESAGRDFVDSPIAVEISCNDYDRESGSYVSTMDQSLIDRIKKLPTIRQLWVIDVSEDGKHVNVYTNDDLKKHFPNAIFSNTAK